MSSITKLRLPASTLTTWQDLLNLMTLKMEVAVAIIVRFDPSEMEIFLASQSAENPFSAGDTKPLDSGLYCEYVFEHRKELIVPNALKDDLWRNSPGAEMGLISYLGLPLMWPNGEAFGTMCMMDNKENAFDENHRQTLKAFKEYIDLYLELYSCKQLEISLSKCHQVEDKCSLALSNFETLLHKA